MSILPEGVPKWWPDRNSRKEWAGVFCQGAEIEIIYCAYEELYSTICSEYWWLSKMITWISRFNLHTRSTGRRRGWTTEDWWQSHGLYLRVAWWVLFVREATPSKQKVKIWRCRTNMLAGWVLSLLFPAGNNYVCSKVQKWVVDEAVVAWSSITLCMYSVH